MGDEIVIARGTKPKNFFCFFVDSDKHSWSSGRYNAQRFKDMGSASECLSEICRRNRARRYSISAASKVD